MRPATRWRSAPSLTDPVLIAMDSGTYTTYAASIREASTPDALSAIKREIEGRYPTEPGERYALLGEIVCRRLELLRDRLGDVVSS